MNLRKEEPADFDAIREVVRAAFDAGPEADLVDRIRASPEYVPEMALVAEREGRIVGHVMISHSAVIRSEEAQRHVGLLSPLAVRPGMQRAGIGGALVRAALARAEDLGEPLILLEGSPDYYRRFGFEPAAAYGIEIHLPDWAPPEAAQIRRLESFDPDDVTLRGTVSYTAAFDGLD